MNGWALKYNYTDQDKRNLTVGSLESLCEVFRESDEGLLVPRAYESFSNVDDFSTTFGGELRTLKAINLRNEQVPAVDAMMSFLETNYGAVLFAPCGKGKTVMGLEMIRRLGRKAVVLVHKTFLVEQWVERVKMFFPSAKVGFWQRDTIPDGSEDIVIAMVQSIVNPNREYPQHLYEMFGTLVADETHRYAAPMWQDAITRFRARNRIGLTATPTRRDGLHEVFLLHIGPIAYEMEGHTRVPMIWRINTDTKIPFHQYRMWNGEANTAKLITLVAQDMQRTDRILRFTTRALKKGRKVLILSERVAHCREMKSVLSKQLDEFTVGLYIGGMKQEAREASAECDVVIGSYAMAQEGLDIPSLDTLILATPKTSITQSVGRILRESPDKKDPVVVDFVDHHIQILEYYWLARKKKYDNLNYKYVDY